MKQQRKETSTEIAQSILQLNTYQQMASFLQKIQQQSSIEYCQVMLQLKNILILQPQRIYKHHDNIAMAHLKIIRNIFKIETNIQHRNFQANSGYIIIAVAQGFLLQGLSPQKMNKLKNIFARKIQKCPNLWGFDGLQSLQEYLMDKTTGYFPYISPIHHQREVDKFSYFLSFYEEYPHIFPQITDIFGIFFKMMLCLRQEKQKDKQLMIRLKQKYFSNRYNLQTTMKNMKFVLQFYKHPFNDKQCQYYPQKALQSILSNYSIQQIENIITLTSVGVLWEQSQIYQYFLNCIKLGFGQISRKMILSMIKFCQKSGKFNELLYCYQNNIKRIFIFMKFSKFFGPCFQILKYFIYSPPPTISIYQKFIPEVIIFMGKVQSQYKFPFLNMLQVVSYAYKQTTSMEELDRIIVQNIESDFNKLSDEEIKKILQDYSWKQKINSKNIKINHLEINKPKSYYKGLTNIGNSCYMNSFLQSLFMNRQFLKHIIRSSTLQIRSQKLKDKKLQGKSKQFIQRQIQQCVKPFAELQKTFSLLLKSIRNDVSPLNIRQVAPEMFRNSSQHDTIEFGRTFLDLIFRNNIPTMFEGEVTIQIFCKECSKIRQRKQAFLDYHVLAEVGELQELVQESFKQQMVKDLTCDHCDKKGEESIKHHFISKYPNYLILSINRFEYDVAQKRNKKNKAKISLNPLLKIKQNSYELYSIIIHTGPSSNAGHYFTFSKSKYQQNSKWICHNDSQVSQFQNFTQVNNFLENSQEDTPYVLFYENKEHIEKIKEELSQPIILRDPQQKFVKKDNEAYLSSQRKMTFQLQPIKYNFFMKKDDEDEDPQDKGGFYNSYIS